MPVLLSSASKGFTVQRGTVMFNNTVTSANVTISSVDPNKTFIVTSYKAEGAGADTGLFIDELTSSTNIAISRWSGSGVAYCSWQAITSN